MRFLRGSLHLSVISRSASLLTIEYCSKKKSMYSHIYTYFFSLSPQPSGVVTRSSQLTTLATNRGVTTAFRLALPAGCTGAGHSSIIARGSCDPLARYGNFSLCSKRLTRPKGGCIWALGAYRRPCVCDGERAESGGGVVCCWLLGRRSVLRNDVVIVCTRVRFLDRHCRRSPVW